MPARSDGDATRHAVALGDLLPRLRRGPRPEAGPVRSHLADGTVVWLAGMDRDAGVVLDAELADQAVPERLRAAYGDEDFWRRWTGMECAVKATDGSVGSWLRAHGLEVPAAAGIELVTHEVDDGLDRWVVSLGRRP